jgi:hypothetical protein
MKFLFFIGLSLSTIVGIWHFFVPYLYNWYSYISDEYRTLIVGIDWTNFFFSLFLTGYSILLIIMNKKIFNKNKEMLIMYGFMVFVWFCRIAITFINPWPLEPIAWAAYGQQIITFIIFSMQFIPFVYLLRRK